MALPPLIPWELHCFPKEIQDELKRRSTNRSLQPINNSNTNWGGNDWQYYKGPMTSWVRICSNGYGVESPVGKEKDKPGFIFWGGKDFYTGYGFNDGIFRRTSQDSNLTVLGYTPDGTAHTLTNDLLNGAFPIHVPPPEIEKVSSNIQKELLRRIRIEWTCFSYKQLEYMTPYFLVPGISVIIEWGWNHFNPRSLLNLADTDALKKYMNNPYPLYTENVLWSKGNYEVSFGIISNFEWAIEGNKIKCVTEVMSKDRLYAGLPINANLLQNDDSLDVSSEQAGPLNVLDNVKTFVEVYLDQFKNFTDTGTKTSEQVIGDITNGTGAINLGTSAGTNLSGLIDYIKKNHKDNWESYLFGVFTGRDTSIHSNPYQISGFGYGNQSGIKIDKNVKDTGANVDDDFDCQNSENLWLNMGLIVEILNYHSSQALGVKGEEFFRVDIDDCVISGHPNLISCDGKSVLIPNALAPKIHSGEYGRRATTMRSSNKNGFVNFINDILVMGEKDTGIKETEKEMDYFNSSTDEYYSLMKTSTLTPFPKVKSTDLKKAETSPSLKHANYKLRRLALQLDEILRDDINQFINGNRIRHSKRDPDPFEFPFRTEYTEKKGSVSRLYSQYFSGYLKNIYVHAGVIKEIFKRADVTTYEHVYQSLFDVLSAASSNFWKLHLVNGTGRESTQSLATMKIVDDNFTQYTSNEGKIFTFDYCASDGLLQNISFRPMLSNLQAYRTIFSNANLDSKQPVVMSETNQMLDYKFRDRLKLGESFSTDKSSNIFNSNTHKTSMAKLQAIKPLDGAFQITTKAGGKPVVCRLAIPRQYASILAMLLDDKDTEFNPRYCGIMPNIQAEFQLQGIAGIRTFSVFRVRGLPEPYSENNIIFRVINVQDQLQGGHWSTNLVAGIIPLKGYFRSKLGIPFRVGDKKS